MAHLISAGVLAGVCPRALIEEVLADTGKASQRERLLPGPAVVYCVMALALWREAPLEEVLRVPSDAHPAGLHVRARTLTRQTLPGSPRAPLAVIGSWLRGA